MKAIKKRIEVDVHQFIKTDPLWPAGVFENSTLAGQYHIITAEGRMDVLDRSYIVTGVKGEKWAIREDIFLETYDVLPEVRVDER